MSVASSGRPQQRAVVHERLAGGHRVKVPALDVTCDAPFVGTQWTPSRDDIDSARRFLRGSRALCGCRLVRLGPDPSRSTEARSASSGPRCR